MKTEAEVGVMQPQAKNAWGHQELGEVRKEPPPEALEGSQSCQHFDFRPPASRTVRE